MKILNIIIVSIITLILSGCGSSNKLNISKYTKSINNKLTLDPFCKSIYTKEKPTVAIVNFTNNSNFGVAKVNDKSSDASIGIGVSIIGIGAGVKSNKSRTARVVDPKLASAFIPLIEKMVLNTGGVKLFTRTDMDKVDKELKLQDSGLLEPSSIVEFGLTSGVKYLITGSIDYVEHNFKNYSQYTSKLSNATRYSNNEDLKIAAATVHLLTSFFDGTKIKTGITIKILDVATGNIVFTEQIKSETKIKSKTQPTYGQLVGAVKSSINEALPSIQDRLYEQFSSSGYITKIKQYKDDLIVKLSIGKNENIKQGDKFIVQNVELSIDPLNNKKTCDKIRTNIILEASEHISSKSTWTKVIDGDIHNIKLLQLVKRK